MVFKSLIFTLIILFSTQSYAMGYTASFFDNNGDETDKVDELSECGKKITEFKFFYKEGKRCIRDTDCIVIKGSCPLGCKFYANKNFEAILSKRITQSEEVCDMTCSAVCRKPETWPKPICTDEGKCVGE